MFQGVRRSNTKQLAVEAATDIKAQIQKNNAEGKKKKKSDSTDKPSGNYFVHDQFEINGEQGDLNGQFEDDGDDIDSEHD